MAPTRRSSEKRALYERCIQQSQAAVRSVVGAVVCPLRGFADEVPETYFADLTLLMFPLH